MTAAGELVVAADGRTGVVDHLGRPEGGVRGSTWFRVTPAYPPGRPDDGRRRAQTPSAIVNKVSVGAAASTVPRSDAPSAVVRHWR